jgi:hypothetical protein
MYKIQVTTRSSRRYSTRFTFTDRATAEFWTAALKPAKGEALRMVVK